MPHIAPHRPLPGRSHHSCRVDAAGKRRTFLPRENPRNLPCGRRSGSYPPVLAKRTQRMNPSPVGQTNPTGRLGYASVKRTRRTMMLSANEANGEIIVKIMFEHEQHDAGLFGRRAPDTAQGVLAKRTRRIDPSPVGRPTQRATRLRVSQTNPTDNDIFRKQSQPPQTKPIWKI